MRKAAAPGRRHLQLNAVAVPGRRSRGDVSASRGSGGAVSQRADCVVLPRMNETDATLGTQSLAPGAFVSRRDPFTPLLHDPLAALLAALREQGMAPSAIPATSGADPLTTYSDGVERVNLGSGNYLGLTTHPEVIAGAVAALQQYGTGVAGSRVLNGTTELHLELEVALAQFYGVEAAVLIGSGYAANLALLGSIGGAGDVLLVDAHAHASLQAGARSSRAEVVRFRHNDVSDLEFQLRRLDPTTGVAVVVDGVYSMEGAYAPLRDIVEVCSRFGARLVVDEAHGLGVLGATGRGVAQELGVEAQVDVITIALSKTLASVGGAILTSRAIAEGLRSRALPYVFSAGNDPAAVGAALAALRVMIAQPERVAAVRNNGVFLRRALNEAGCPPLPGLGAVVGVNVGDELEAVRTWQDVFDHGVYSNVVSYPAVPQGSAMLRMSVMATHSEDQLLRAANVIAAAVRRKAVRAGQDSVREVVVPRPRSESVHSDADLWL